METSGIVTIHDAHDHSVFSLIALSPPIYSRMRSYAGPGLLLRGIGVEVYVTASSRA